MLGKLIKYELKASMRVMLPLYALTVLMSLLNRSLIIESVLNLGSNELMFGTLILVYTIVMVAMFIMTVATVIQRFSRTMLGNEGYLMHTLPVSVNMHIASKMIVAIILSILSGLMMFASVLIMTMGGEMLQILSMLYTEIVDGLKLIWVHGGFVFMLEVIYLWIVGMVQSVMIIYASMSIGHLFAKHRVFMSIIGFIGICTVMNILSSFTIQIGNSFDHYIEYGGLLSMAVQGPILAEMLITTLCAGGCFFITKYILQNKLNLE